MILERLPEVLALGTEEKEPLAEELLSQVLLEKDNAPALSALLRERLAEHEANPEASVRREELRDRLLKKRDASDCWKAGKREHRLMRYAGRREAPPFLEPKAALRLLGLDTVPRWGTQ